MLLSPAFLPFGKHIFDGNGQEFKAKIESVWLTSDFLEAYGRSLAEIFQVTASPFEICLPNGSDGRWTEWHCLPAIFMSTVE